jgi:hypothetical protein
VHGAGIRGWLRRCWPGAGRVSHANAAGDRYGAVRAVPSEAPLPPHPRSCLWGAVYPVHRALLPVDCVVHTRLCMPMSAAAASADAVRAVGGSLPTPGGGVIEVSGTNVGLASAAVALSYAGSLPGLPRRSYTSASCVVVRAGAVVQCSTPPGIGAEFAVVLDVDGGASEPSAGTVSYAPPAITSVSGPGAEGGPAVGGAEILLQGANFGPADSGSAVTAWASPAGR